MTISVVRKTLSFGRPPLKIASCADTGMGGGGELGGNALDGFLSHLPAGSRFLLLFCLCVHASAGCACQPQLVIVRGGETNANKETGEEDRKAYRGSQEVCVCVCVCVCACVCVTVKYGLGIGKRATLAREACAATLDSFPLSDADGVLVKLLST